MRNTFRSIGGKTLVVAAAFASSCSYNDFPEPIDCSTSGLAVVLESKTDVTNCTSLNGAITVSATGGEPPYVFSINGGEYQTSGAFTSLGSGRYTLSVKDGNDCISEQTVDILSTASTLTASVVKVADSDCYSNNGSITVTAAQGQSPYQYKLGDGSFGTTNTFINLKFGNYTVIVKDANECTLSLNITVDRGVSGISYSNDIKPILDTNCNVSGCHNGSLGAARDWRTYSNVKANAQNIKTKTTDKSMPPGGGLTQKQIDQIACWVDDGAPEN